MIPVHIINYTPFRERLADTLHALAQCNLATDLRVINAWDKEDLNPALLGHDVSDIWRRRVSAIYPILAANAKLFKTSTTQDLESHGLPEVYPEWAQARLLSAGELSVLLKHYHAISAIAVSSASHGIVVEDDVRAPLSSQKDVCHCIAESIEQKIDYLDLAGGCGLRPYPDECQSASSRISILRVPRTRTVAAYMMSRRLASKIANQFMPLVFPIDWHIQYIMLQIEEFKCAWTVDPPLLHGVIWG